MIKQAKDYFVAIYTSYVFSSSVRLIDYVGFDMATETNKLLWDMKDFLAHIDDIQHVIPKLNKQ